ncbi:MAG: LD-carboxypeptidase [Chitinophagaceae bacterium]|nr:LD-carboxypeptidase [Chitinophagaceae bacterium]
MRMPPYLKPGARIGITCPAGAVSLETMTPMIQQLQDWGFEVYCGQNVGTSFGKFSSPDDVRLADLQALLDDDRIEAILFCRGGYGLVRILDRINFSRFVQNPKWLLGYSDITYLHSHVNRQFEIVTGHTQMSGGYLPDSYDVESIQSIFSLLSGKPLKYSFPSHPMNRCGQARGVLTGGNLAILSDLAGSLSEVDTSGKILVIEDVGEYLYNIDRMLWQLKRAGKLDQLAGLVVGSFTDTKDNEISFGMDVCAMVEEKVKEYVYPVCYDFPVGHQARNVALKLGAEHVLEITETGCCLKEEVE